MGALTAQDRLLGLASIWREVRYNYPMWHRHPDLDWDAEFRERLLLVSAEQPDWDYYRSLQAFAALVRDSHVSVWPPGELAQGFLRPPLVLFPIGRSYVVVGVRGQAAQKAGVRLGDEVVSVDGTDVDTYAAEHVSPYVSAPTDHDRRVRAARTLLEGPVGSEVGVGLKRPNGTEYECGLVRDPNERSEWRWYEPLVTGNKVTSRPLARRIGLITIESFGEEGVVRDFDAALRRLGDLQGLVLDVRTNGGGNSGWSDQIIGRLVGEPIPGMRERRAFYSPALRSWGMGDDGVGTRWEEHQMGPLAPEGPLSFHGPLAILTSAATHSAAEDFVGPLKCSGRALTIGGTTAGSTGNPLTFPLPGGGGFRVCTRYMQLPDGAEFIGIGIPPDIEVSPTATDIAEARDPVLDRAVEELSARR
jgi:carboxyl-terminal processing protease